MVNKSIIAYKVFRVTKTSTGSRLLKGPYTGNTKLQKTGDKASHTGSPVVCGSGWHGVLPKHIRHHTSDYDWQTGASTVFKVRLSGTLARGENKIAAQHIEMLEEIRWKDRVRIFPGLAKSLKAEALKKARAQAVHAWQVKKSEAFRVLRKKHKAQEKALRGSWNAKKP